MGLGGQEGSAGPLKGSFFPSKSCVWHQICFQTPHNGSNGKCLQGTGVSVGINYQGIYIVKVILTELYMLEYFL